MHVRSLFANPSHNANSVTEFDFPWRANANANFVLLILRIEGDKWKDDTTCDRVKGGGGAGCKRRGREGVQGGSSGHLWLSASLDC